MKTRVNQFIDAVIAEINALSNDKKDYDVLITLESEISMELLSQLLEGLKRKLSQSEEDASESNLHVLSEFLADRWENIQRTDAIYPHTPTSRINRACHILARHLANILNRHQYDLLMPTVKFTNYQLKLSEFILRDDGVTPLEVVEGFACLEDKRDEMKIQENLLRQESPVRDSRNKLSLAEVHRILCHSKEAPGYYKAIYATKNSDEEAKFIEAIKSENYKVTASYSTEGDKWLLNCILRKVSTRDELASFMTRYLTKESGWQLFLDRLCSLSPENMFRIMLDMDIDSLNLKYNGRLYSDTIEFHKALLPDASQKLPVILKFDLITNHDQLHIRALIVSLLRTYKLTRNEGPEFKSIFGHSIGYRLWGATTYSKEDKLKACDVLIGLVMSNEPLENIRNHPLFKKHEGPLMHDTLGAISKILVDLAEKKVEDKRVLKV
jgi:hypothetical protein